MYEVKVDNNFFDIVDLYEVNTILTKKTIEKSEYFDKLQKEIFKLYYDVYQKMDNVGKIKGVIKYQLLIDNAYSYLLDGKGGFENYFEKQSIKMPEIEKIYEKLQSSQRVNKGICFNPEEIKENQTVIEKDQLGFFYYFAFTVFYLDNYLLHQFAMFTEIFKKKSFTEEQVKQLHIQMVRIFSEDFAEGFRLFEKGVVETYVS